MSKPYHFIHFSQVRSWGRNYIFSLCADQLHADWENKPQAEFDCPNLTYCQRSAVLRTSVALLQGDQQQDPGNGHKLEQGKI